MEYNGYKISHSVTSGNIERTSGFKFSDDGLFFQHQPDVCLSGRAGVPSLLNHPQRLSSPIAGPSHLHDSDNLNIVIESISGKHRIKSVDSTVVCERIQAILNQISGGHLSEATEERVLPVIQNSINDAPVAWFNLLTYAVDGEDVRKQAGKFYRNIISGQHIVELRISDHYTVIARKFNGNKPKNPKAQQHVSVNLFDEAKMQMLNKHKPFIGDGQPGAHFDGKNKRIGIVEITFDMLKLSSTDSNDRIADIVAMLKSLDRLVSLEDASPSNVDAVMKTEPSLDGKFKVDTNIEDLNSATMQDMPKAPLTDAVNQPPLTNIGECVMNTYQKSYTAFMESVCKQFNCTDALPALKEGFEALCEATNPDWAYKVHEYLAKQDGRERFIRGVQSTMHILLTMNPEFYPSCRTMKDEFDEVTMMESAKKVVDENETMIDELVRQYVDEHPEIYHYSPISDTDIDIADVKTVAMFIGSKMDEYFVDAMKGLWPSL